jgi:antitoxin VapB
VRLHQVKAHVDLHSLSMYIRVNHMESSPVGEHQTKTFRSGNSIALRLPKALDVGPDELMMVSRHGNVLTARLADDPDEKQRKFREMIEDLGAMSKPGSVQKRQPIEWPERRGS